MEVVLGFDALRCSDAVPVLARTAIATQQQVGCLRQVRVQLELEASRALRGARVGEGEQPKCRLAVLPSFDQPHQELAQTEQRSLE